MPIVLHGVYKESEHIMTSQKKPSRQDRASEVPGLTSAKANTYATFENYSKHPAKDLTARQLLIARHS